MDPNTLINSSDAGNCFTFTATEISTFLAIINAFFAIIIGITVAIVAIQQWRLSRAKFRLDLFEKRYTVFKATQRFLSFIFKDAKSELDKLFEFRGNTQDSVFLFKKDIPQYLSEIDEKALKLWEIEESLKEMPKGTERSTLCREKTQLIHELTSELPKLKDVYGKYMKFDKWK